MATRFVGHARRAPISWERDQFGGLGASPGHRLARSDADLTADDYTVCQAIAARAREWGFAGLLAPSAAEQGAVNVVVFADHVHEAVSIHTVTETTGRNSSGHVEN